MFKSYLSRYGMGWFYGVHMGLFFFIIITVLSAPAKQKSPALEGFSPQYGGWKDYVNNLPV